MYTLSSKSAHADALTPIFVAIAEPQLPEPMSATFSGIVAGIYVRERRLSIGVLDCVYRPH